MSTDPAALFSREAVDGVRSQYDAVREDVGITDVSGWTKLRVLGDAARDVLDVALTGPILNMTENGIVHTMALDDAGRFVADVLVLGGFEDFTLLARPPLGGALKEAVAKAVGDDAEVADVTESLDLVRIDGPGTAELPRMVLGSAVAGMRIMTFAETEFDGRPLTVGRLGMTGEFGFFFLGDPEAVGAAVAAIREAAPEAVDCAPELHNLLEMETRTFNSRIDLPKAESPLEAGLHWMVDFRKPEFVGRESLLALNEDGLARRMICLRLDGGDAVPDRLAPVTLPDGGGDVGYIANAGFSPSAGTGIALAYVETALAAVGVPLQVATAAGPVSARIVSAPFFTTRSNART